MPVVINEFEVVADPPPPPADGKPVAAPPVPPPTPNDLAAVARHAEERAERVRAH